MSHKNHLPNLEKQCLEAFVTMKTCKKTKQYFAAVRHYTILSERYFKAHHVPFSPLLAAEHMAYLIDEEKKQDE